MYSIYRLTDPRTQQVRYIGLSNNPLARFNAHMHDAHTNRLKYEWIAELAHSGLQPDMTVIEDGISDAGQAAEREQYWIDFYEAQGVQLTNLKSTPRYRFSRQINAAMAMLPPARPQVFYTIKEAAQTLRVSDETIRRMINNGQLEAIRVRGGLAGRGQWRIRKESLDKYISQQN